MCNFGNLNYGFGGRHGGYMNRSHGCYDDYSYGGSHGYNRGCYGYNQGFFGMGMPPISGRAAETINKIHFGASGLEQIINGIDYLSYALG